MPRFSNLAEIVVILLLCLPQDGSSFRLSYFTATSVKSHQTRPRPNVAYYPRYSGIGPLPSNSCTRSLALFVSASSSSSSSSSKKTQSGRSRVVYQKVVKPPGTANDNPLLLGKLVEYLQDHFELPAKLPMVYQKVEQGDSDSDHNDMDQPSIIASWDSPLSPSPDATRLDLEVVAIYADDENDKQRSVLPSMAMVVVRKAAKTKSFSPMAPMMHDLFADSERRILKALDRGLEDFLMGKVELASDSETTASTKNNIMSMQEAQDAMIEELLQDAAVNHPSVSKDDNDNNNAIDVDFSEVKKESKPGASNSKKAAATTISSLQTLKITTNGNDTNNDFAVQAARKAALQKISKVGSASEDFAVAAARRAVELNISNNKNTQQAANESSSKPASLRMQKKAASVQESTSPRAFRAVVSTPQMFKQRQKKLQAANIQSVTTASSTAVNATISTAPVTEQTTRSAQATLKGQKQRRLNLNIVDGDDDDEAEQKPTSPPVQSNTSASKKVTAKDQSDAATFSTKSSNATAIMPTEEEIAKTAQSVMDQLAEQGEELSAEEMLEKVMKFGKEQDRENAVGSGFVSGAFEKAKELLREQKRQHEQRLQRKIADQISNEFELAPDTEMKQADKRPAERPFKEKASKRSKEEEELRRFFEAGERLADGRISLATSPEVTGGSSSKQPRLPTPEEEKLVDELIAGDKSVSSHARILDDELAELEVRINKSPGEELDGPSSQKNPLFDVFSGPETYNPNVDPETAVNWPGALPGTKLFEGRNRLHKELNEAIKQAKFAAEVLGKLDEKEVMLDGETKKQYFVGNRELSKQQVDNLRAVVAEAAEIGIIQDPLILMAERSRVQMVLDELWSQPEERVRDIVSSYKDLLLSDNFVMLIKERLQSMADHDLDALRQNSEEEEESEEDRLRESKHQRERDILGQLVAYAQLLLKETRALGAELESQQLEVIRSICKVAMDPSHTTEEEAAMALSDAVRDMRPLFDDMFVAYLKYAVAEEEGRLARAGVLDDPEHNQWLFVLKIVQQGVHAEIAKGINRYIEHIWYVLRMETPTERGMLLEKLIDVMPTLDVRPFVQVVDNIVGSLGEAARGEFAGATALGEMTNKLLQLHRDMKELLPPERVDEMSRDADEWAANRKKKLLEQRNLTMQRLRAGRETEQYDQEIETLVGRRGETERFE